MIAHKEQTRLWEEKLTSVSVYILDNPTYNRNLI